MIEKPNKSCCYFDELYEEINNTFNEIKQNYPTNDN